MSYDRWLEQPYQDFYDAQDQAEEAYEMEYESVVDCIKNDRPINYGSNRSTTVDHCDFGDKVSGRQKEIMQLIANGNKDELWKVMLDIFDHEVDQFVDLKIGVSKR